MIFESNSYSLTIIEEQSYTLNSCDNVRSYSKEYVLDPEERASSIYGINCGEHSNCVLLASGGASAITDQSAVIHDSKVWIGIGDQLVCLSLPLLEIMWHQKIDDITCFGVYASPDGLGLLVHGELIISKVDFLGELIWSTSGKDIFTEGFTVFEDYVEAIDFNNEKYRIEISNGKNELV
ncbi:MAG: hypothetical protein ACJAW8_000606 [Oleispira sp.]|jgi:hypothetical protein